MRLGTCIGTMSLTRCHPTLRGKRFVLVIPRDLKQLTEEALPRREELIAVDEIGATAGALVALAEGVEAAFPFYPTKVPIDAYVACLIDELTIDAAEQAKLLGGK